MLLKEGLEHVRIIHVHFDHFAIALSRNVCHKAASWESHAIFVEWDHIFRQYWSLSFSIVVVDFLSLCFSVYLLAVL